MAIWQYDFVAVPRDELSLKLGALPSVLTREQFGEMRFWTARQPPRGFELGFTRWRPEMESWSPGRLRIWGSENSDRIDAHFKDDRLTRIGFRVELRSLNLHFIETIAEFARASNCILISAHSLAVVEPLRQLIVQHINRSPGANRVVDWLLNPESPTSSPVRQSVFLSHSSVDKPFVSRLATDLRSRDVPVWFDQWELRVGDSLTEKIERGISESGWLAVVLSKNSVGSDWVQKELRAAQARELRDKNVFVLPIVIDECEVPLFLLDKLYADFRHSYEHGLEALLKRVGDGGPS